MVRLSVLAVSRYKQSRAKKHQRVAPAPAPAATPISRIARSLLCFGAISILAALVGSQLVAGQGSFVDSSALKPNIILILPQSFKVPTNPFLVPFADSFINATQLEQYVALINNVQNEHDDQLLRQQYRKLTLQVRDASTPITGQLFYEHVFDYFPPNQQHLLVPIDLEQVSPSHEQARGGQARATGAKRAQQLTVSIRPYQLDSGFGSENIEFVSSAPISVETVPSSDGRHNFALVQTDKPIYKPEDKVLIRSLVVNENLRPITGDELRLQVRNPHKIIIEEIRFPLANSSSSDNNNNNNNNEAPLFLDHVFEFPPEPMQGTWSIHLLHNDPIANDSTNFEVREYVLPTYEIEFESPSYILPSAQNITGSIVAKYHHGKPVQGKAQFKFGYKESPNAKPKFVARSSIKSIDPATGRADYKVPTSKFKETNWFPSIAGHRFVVEATVTEMASGHREIGQHSECIFISYPYRVSFDNSIEDFKPGLSQPLTVQLLEMQTNRPAPAGARLIASYRDHNGSLLDPQSLALSNKPVDLRQQLDSEAFTDSQGRASFNVGPVGASVSSIQVTVRWLGPNSAATHLAPPVDRARLAGSSGSSAKHRSAMDTELAVGHHTLVKHESSNGWMLLANKGANELKVGDQFVSDLLFRDAAVIPRKLFYTIVARGRIISLANLDSDGLVKFEASELMVPSIRLIVFALTDDSNGLLSDSMRIDIGQDFNCNMTIRYKSNSIAEPAAAAAAANNSTATANTFRPNDKGKLAIQARQGDFVSLIGVDSAVYTLNNRSQLESSRIVERIRRLDLGCGFGGGKNNVDVFHNAGLLIFKDMTANSNQQHQYPATFIGSSCLTMENQLRLLEDVQLGYSRPQFSAAAQLNRPPRPMNSIGSAGSSARQARTRREVDIEGILRRYKDPVYRACCRLGTLEDLPQRRNCSVRAKIVERYMRSAELQYCPMIYFDCCRAVFGEHYLLGSMMVSGRDGNSEPEVFQSRVVNPLQAAQYAGESLANVGHLDRIESQTLVRKDFRETWLFEVVRVNESDGSASLQVQLPHSITSWSISALALNRYQPMCVPVKALKLVTFQELHLQVSMPFKVIQGEQIDLVASVFNYSPQSQEVLVYMYGIENVCSEAEPGERSERKRIRLERFGSQSLLFPMIPLQTGKFRVKILAISQLSGGSDIVERVLNVVPRGKPVVDETTFSLDPMNHQRRNKRAIQTGNLLDEIDSSKGLQRSKVRLTPSRDSEYIVPQTQECIVSAIGDRMGQSVQTSMVDVENLIRLPHGCGEQVMIYLGPTLYTTRYLSSMNKLTGDLRWRAIRYIQSGYKRILNYRKENGAFSAFARRDPSIWLTAFIAKMLCQTERTPFVADEIHVDRTVVNSALNWLVERQNKETGTWIELNPVYHREMLGGVLKENALTAFVVLALNECAHHSADLVEETPIEEPTRQPENEHDQQQQHPDRQSQRYATERHSNGIDKLKVATQRAEQALILDKYKAVKERHPYVLALTSYALSYSKPRDSLEALQDLLTFADRSPARNQLSWRGEYPIETSAYALQALIELAPLFAKHESTTSTRAAGWVPGTDAQAIANWLTSRRSYTGAFESTQDTVVALEALSKFAQLQVSANGFNLVPQSSQQAGASSSSLVCNVTTMSNRTRRSIEFGKDNAQVLQTFKLSSQDIENEMLDIVTSGNGIGTMSVKLKYNVLQEEDELCRFDIDSSIEEWQPKITVAAPKAAQSADQLPSAERLVSTGANQHQSENGEDNYLKSFDKAMLSELNLIDINQVYLQQQQQQQQQQQVATTVASTPRVAQAEPVLRLRRATPHVMDLSRPSNHSGANSDSWTSKMVTSFKSIKLPTWLAPKSTTTEAPVGERTSSEAPDNWQQATSSEQSSSSAHKRTNTARRSAQSTPIPLIVHPGRIPASAKLNTLSKDLFPLGGGALVGGQNSSSQQQVASADLAHKLVLLLRVCVHHLSSRRDSEMAVIEVGILSGFKPNEADLSEITKEEPAMKYEISADRSLVIIYMQYIPFSGPYCLQFRLIRDSFVYNLQSGYIRVYEYYSPAHSCANFYTPTRVSDLIETKCDSSGQVCECAAKSLCPATSKLLDLGEIHSVNASSARNQLMELVCSPRFDLVSLVRLKTVKNLETGKMFKLAVRLKSDLRGNLSSIMAAQRQQRAQLAVSMRKPQLHGAQLDPLPASAPLAGQSFELIDEHDDQQSSLLDNLNLSVDSSCVRNDPFLLHFAHPNQWKQGGELLILFARSQKLERRYFKLAAKSGSASSIGAGASFPKPKPNILTGAGKSADQIESELREASLFELDAQQLQYSTNLPLDKDSILYDITYLAKSEPRQTINNLILWLELRFRREGWSCPAQQAAAL